MLNFDEKRFLAIQSGAVATAGELDAIVGAALEAGAPNIFFLGTGGAAILMQPAVDLLRARSAFPVFGGHTAELLAAGSTNLKKGSLVILPSLSGTTKESVAFLELAKKRGAEVVSLVGHADTPLGRDADHAIVNFAADDTSSESFYVQSLFAALSVMKHRGEIDNYDALVAEIQHLPRELLRMKKAVEPKAEDYAKVIAGSDWHIVCGAGNVWYEAFYYGMCILEEMQWIRTRPIHAGDFFHGTLELVEKGVSVILMKGEGPNRALAERVEAFVPKVGGSLTILDTKDYPTEGLSAEARELLAPAFLATMLERISAHLEVMRDHPLTTRRYYRRVEY
ncbi:SIS domain-containing protein [Afifella sp. JA880]|uniref:SIS domain-containing protein n=1 Tax=Afifella sp. JA880 TaxID=2975280 RepID=UPI0021BB37B5|nr:SIS domain-containing protein [Afifella sp. JA880]MCT8268290.1 SIS domain-containing protein [Afifella sp. JA880]